MTTSAWVSPNKDGKLRNGLAVRAQSEAAGANGVQTSVMAAPLLRSVPNCRVGEGLHGGEMKIGFGQRRYIGCSAESRHPLAALDPAHLVAELPSDPDV